MLPLSYLLNPAPEAPEAASPSPSRPSSAFSSPTASFAEDQMPDRHLVCRKHLARDLNEPTCSRTRGTVNFPPFEDLDEVSVREARKFHIQSLGSIRNSGRRIPYKTGKRDFHEKTGRDFFEVFQYDFRVPGDDTPWTVMWDYEIGLVRTTPFFKVCKYSKTMSAKMLNQNPGLRDISHSITGGSIMAQGYWMPFDCARAVCATFCHAFAGALIPLFGPRFPSECILKCSPNYGRMKIDPSIILRSKREAEIFRLRYGGPPSFDHLPSGSDSPRSPELLAQHIRSRRHLVSDNSGYAYRGVLITDSPGSNAIETDYEAYSHTNSRTPVLSTSSWPAFDELSLRRTSVAAPAVAHSSPGWTAVNHRHQNPIHQVHPSRPQQQQYQQQLHAPARHDEAFRGIVSNNNSPHELPDPCLSALPRFPAGLHGNQKHYHPRPPRTSTPAIRPHSSAATSVGVTPISQQPPSAAPPLPSPFGDRRERRATYDDDGYDASESQGGVSSPESTSSNDGEKGERHQRKEKIAANNEENISSSASPTPTATALITAPSTPNIVATKTAPDADLGGADVEMAERSTINNNKSRKSTRDLTLEQNAVLALMHLGSRSASSSSRGSSPSDAAGHGHSRHNRRRHWSINDDKMMIDGASGSGNVADLSSSSSSSPSSSEDEDKNASGGGNGRKAKKRQKLVASSAG